MNLKHLTDKTLLQEIRPLLRKNKVLEAVGVCIKFYKGRYQNMSFKDWFKLVNTQYQKVDQNG